MELEDYDFVITPWVEQKLAIHQVTIVEVEEALANSGVILQETRPQHKTIPPTYWFIANTFDQRPIKVVFILKGLSMVLKTAYEPDQAEVAYYENSH